MYLKDTDTRRILNGQSHRRTDAGVNDRRLNKQMYEVCDKLLGNANLHSQAERTLVSLKLQSV